MAVAGPRRSYGELVKSRDGLGLITFQWTAYLRSLLIVRGPRRDVVFHLAIKTACHSSAWQVPSLRPMSGRCTFHPNSVYETKFYQGPRKVALRREKSEKQEGQDKDKDLPQAKIWG